MEIHLSAPMYPFLPTFVLPTIFSFIPHYILRVLAVGLWFIGMVVSVLYSKWPPTRVAQLHSETHAIQLIIDDMVVDHRFPTVDTLEVTVRLVKTKFFISLLQRDLLNTRAFTLNHYRRIFRSISACAADVKQLRVDVELLAEDERQYQYKRDLDAAENFLRHRLASGTSGFVISPV